MSAVRLSQRFPKKERLGKSEFLKAFSDGRRFTDGILAIHVLQREKKKAGFVARRSVKPVVEKNRIKRLLREIYRKNKHTIADDVWLIVVAGEKAKERSFAELEISFLGLLKKGGVLR